MQRNHEKPWRTRGSFEVRHIYTVFFFCILFLHLIMYSVIRLEQNNKTTKRFVPYYLSIMIIIFILA